MAGDAPIGVTIRTLTAWEYGAVNFLDVLDEEDAELNASAEATLRELRLVDAKWGDVTDDAACCDITSEVLDLLAVARQVAEPGTSSRAEIPATTRQWGDPARFRVKQLQVTVEYDWLSKDERSAMQWLRGRAGVKAQMSEDLEPLLQRLGAAFVNFGASELKGPQDLGPQSLQQGAVELGRTSPRWRQLGFQSSDPRSDFRTGITALDSLVYLLERYPMAARQMVREAHSDGLDYPFAVASINISQLLARYLHLVGDGTGGSRPLVTAPKRVVRQFARMMVEMRSEADLAAERWPLDPLGEVHTAVMTCLHAIWKAWRSSNPSLTVMAFGPALDEAMANLHEFCLTHELNSVGDFRELSARQCDRAAPEEASSRWQPSEESSSPVNEALAGLKSSVQSTVESVSALGTYLSGALVNGW